MKKDQLSWFIWLKYSSFSMTHMFLMAWKPHGQFPRRKIPPIPKKCTKWWNFEEGFSQANLNITGGKWTSNPASNHPIWNDIRDFHKYKQDVQTQNAHKTQSTKQQKNKDATTKNRHFQDNHQQTKKSPRKTHQHQQKSPPKPTKIDKSPVEIGQSFLHLRLPTVQL